MRECGVRSKIFAAAENERKEGLKVRGTVGLNLKMIADPSLPKTFTYLKQGQPWITCFVHLATSKTTNCEGPSSKGCDQIPRNLKRKSYELYKQPIHYESLGYAKILYILPSSPPPRNITFVAQVY